LAGGGAYDRIGHAGPLDLPCGEQGKLLPPKKFILPERDINMSEHRKPKSSFMQELEQWCRAEVIDPLLNAGARSTEDGDFDWEGPADESVEAIKAKVLQSYRNGFGGWAGREVEAPTRPSVPPRKGYQRNTEVRTSRWPIRA